jgi:hypothetical protein
MTTRQELYKRAYNEAEAIQEHRSKMFEAGQIIRTETCGNCWKEIPVIAMKVAERVPKKGGYQMAEKTIHVSFTRQVIRERTKSAAVRGYAPCFAQRVCLACMKTLPEAKEVT